MPREFRTIDTSQQLSSALHSAELKLQQHYRRTNPSPEILAEIRRLETVADDLDTAIDALPPTSAPTDVELKDAFKERRVEEERHRLAFEKAEQELRDEGKLPPLPAPAEPAKATDIAAEIEADARQRAAVDTLAEAFYDEARLDLASQIAGLSVDEMIQLLKDEIAVNSDEVAPPPEPEPKVSLFKRLTGGA